MHNKQYYFISGLPRSGSTLLSAILKQNPDFYADITSPVSGIIQSAIDGITGSENNLNLNEERRKAILASIFDGYYSFTETPVVFDTSRGWSSKTSTLKALFPYTKILCCVRDIGWILDSFERISSKNPFHSNTLVPQDKNVNVFSRCDAMMDQNGGIIISVWALLQEGYAINPNMIKLIEYEDLCKNPEKTIKSIYEFIDKPYYEHDFDNVEYSNENFDLSCNLKDLHTVRKKVEWVERKSILPPEVWKKYSNMEFWRPNYKNNKLEPLLDYK
jgi:sulfotransferase